ncbi:MAG: cytochrome-c peroxidase [Deltaproteobacteria bacterium]|nr:cytochrome-c peroxidase [Deltaproteobacteria bacterium]
MKIALVTLGFLLGSLCDARADEVVISVPKGVTPPQVPADNPLTAAGVELGKKLYFDSRLSKDDTISCATCHDPRTGFAEHKPVSDGVAGGRGNRNAPTVMNAAFLPEQFWDGRAPSLEAQAVGPIINPVEMAMPDHPAVERKLAALAEYPPLFQKAFGDPKVTIDRIGKALASFERTLISLDAPIDRFLGGDATAISDSAKRGWVLYNGKALCVACHAHVPASPLFSDGKYHNLGVAAKPTEFLALAKQLAQRPADFEKLANAPGVEELGRFAVSRNPQDLGAFKTPHLRNIALTAPYMHDGSEETLAEVIEYYDRGGNKNPWLDPNMRPLGLTAQEKADLVALLETFTSTDLARFDELGKLMPE